jgi:hypothetical protein
VRFYARSQRTAEFNLDRAAIGQMGGSARCSVKPLPTGVSPLLWLGSMHACASPYPISLLPSALRRLRLWIVDSPCRLRRSSLLVTSLPLTITVAVTILVGVTLPTAFALLSGYVIDTLPAAIEQGPGSPGGQRMLGAAVALGLTFLATQVVISA